MRSSPIVGTFVFPDFWENLLRAKSKLAHLRACGVNAIMTESDSYELQALDAVHKAGLRFFAGVACFSDHASNFGRLLKRPELWPILESGQRRPQMEWYVGMSPTDRRRQEEALAEIRSVARSYPVDGIFLDFARWPLHWEIELRPHRERPLDSSFDAATLAMFEEATGALPPDLDTTSARAAWIHRNRLSEWIEFKCKVVNDFVSEAREAVKEAKADAELGILRGAGRRRAYGAVDRAAYQGPRAVSRLDRAHALSQHFAATACVGRIDPRSCGRSRPEEDAAGLASRFEPGS